MFSYKHLIYFRCLGGVKNSPLYGVKKSPPRRLLIKYYKKKKKILKEKWILESVLFWLIFPESESVKHPLTNIDLF